MHFASIFKSPLSWVFITQKQRIMTSCTYLESDFLAELVDSIYGSAVNILNIGLVRQHSVRLWAGTAPRQPLKKLKKLDTPSENS